MRRSRRAARSPILGSSIAFGLLLGVIVVLFLRPAEIVPALANLPIYEVLILGCLALALPIVLMQALRPRDEPITACVLGLLLAVIASHLSHGFIWGARHSGPDFAKLAVFYLLVVGLVTTPQRFRKLLTCVSACVFFMTMLAVLQYYGMIDVPALQSFEQIITNRVDPATGRAVVLLRLCGAGIFNDPNDFCLILILGLMLSLWRCATSPALPRKIAALLAAGLFLWALSLTHSRGGFIALLAAVLTLAVSRGGKLRAVLIGVPVTAGLFFAFAGRQTEISASEGTGLSRLQLWSESLRLFRTAPVFGIGMDRFVEEVRLVVHNSFLHCFTELGMFGGTLFLGAFVFAVATLWRMRRADAVDASAPPDLVRLRPYLLAALVGYIVGYLSLSRSYSVPTYLILAIVVCYARLMARTGFVAPKLGIRTFARLAVLSVMFLAASYLFIRVFVRWG